MTLYRGKITPITMLVIRHFGGQKDVIQYFSNAERKEQPIILHPMKMPFRNEGEIKTFSDEGKLENLERK